jgi:hypothetical protein
LKCVIRSDGFTVGTVGNDDSLMVVFLLLTHCSFSSLSPALGLESVGGSGALVIVPELGQHVWVLTQKALHCLYRRFCLLLGNGGHIDNIGLGERGVSPSGSPHLESIITQ